MLNYGNFLGITVGGSGCMIKDLYLDLKSIKANLIIMYKFLITSILALILFSSCKDDTNKLSAINTDTIQNPLFFKVTDINTYERKALNELELPIPKSIRRFYITENGSTKNFYSECLYENGEGLIASTYLFLNVTFIGDSTNLSVKYKMSAGRGHSGEGYTFNSDISNSIYVQETYGMDASILEVRKNGKVELQKVSEF